jgi:DNA/RNA-binding domain of Phe-tRNA-synthetase-like protein
MNSTLESVAASIVVDPAVFRLRPDFAAMILLVDGLPSGPSDDDSRALLAAVAAAAPDPATDPQLAAWRAAYAAFGAKPNRTRSSVEALARRAPAGLPEVNVVVDLYNAVSLIHRLPVGGEDLDRYAGAPRLVRATGEETFDTVASGEAVVERPEPGEVVWRDDLGVTCRRWNHRQCVRTRISESSVRGIFQLERLEPLSLAGLAAATDDLLGRLSARAPRLRYASRLLMADGRA